MGFQAGVENVSLSLGEKGGEVRLYTQCVRSLSEWMG